MPRPLPLRQEYEPHGNIWIEGRESTFVIHAAYGLVPATRLVRDLMPGDEIIIDGVTLKIFARYLDRVEASHPEVEGGRSFGLDEVVDVPGIEDDFDPSIHPLAGQWRYNAHPEFANEDLDDLEEAIHEFKQARRQTTVANPVANTDLSQLVPGADITELEAEL